MKRLIKIKKPLAALMLLLFTVNTFFPGVAFALTSGPSQPEMKGFEPASTSNLVDAFTGDFTYNIPLMDVGGYPINLSYHSGSGMDDEASWTGFGWSLNPGVINRNMRGLPDDFRGDVANPDQIVKEFHLRPDITGGIKFGLAPEFFGFDASSVVKIGAEAGVFYNNKRGLGVEFGLDANTSLLSNTKVISGFNTAGLSAKANLSFNSQTGASFNPSLNFSISGISEDKSEKTTLSLGLGASINSRAGLQYTSLGATYNSKKFDIVNEKKIMRTENASFVSYASQTFVPETQADFFNESFALAPQFGLELWGVYAGAQLTGHYTSQKVAHTRTSYNAYGFLHNYEGKDDAHGLMDFNREKDVPYFDGVPNLPVPLATPDLFTVSAQDGTAQYRAYLGGTGIFSDHDAFNTSIAASLGVEVGAGSGFKVGGDLQASLSKTVTTKWKTGNKILFADNNSYDANGSFAGALDAADPAFEPVYFKRVGEQVPNEGSILNKVNTTVPVRVKTIGEKSGPTALSVLTGKDNTDLSVAQKITRSNREARNNGFSYLTAAQARVAGLDKNIYDYLQAAGGFKPLLSKCNISVAPVSQAYKRDHHIGEITITDEAGARKVYGIPAYNTYQEDVSFGVERSNNNIGNVVDDTKGLVAYSGTDASTNNKKGNDFYYSKEIIPAYAHSFLLTGILSSDYVDVKNDGITDDDLGTAVKFNYWRKTDNFQWRTPYAAPNTAGAMANYNPGLISDAKDDKANYSYGRKELWYMHSIESKTMVAVFETGDREDALGADVNGNKDVNPANKQQYLKTIKLYSKADWYKNAATAIPIKTVNFVYDYSLFADNTDITKGIPNNSSIAITPTANILANQGGKLTLKKVYFTYQNNTKGNLQPYEFVYDFNAAYAFKQYDRWGNYKNVADGNPVGVNNDNYSYSTQDKTKADANAALWQMTQINTPAGGIIKIKYESDDYSYVQNRKAMQMYPMAGVGSAVNNNSGYYEGDKIYVKLPESLGSDAELRAKYFDGGANDYNQNLFFKAYTKLRPDQNLYDYVSGYAEIANINTDVRLATGYTDVAEIKVRKIQGENVSKDFHPIAKAAWQFMRLNTPKLVYPGYNVREESAPMQFVKALIGAISSMSELLAPFDTRAQIKQLAPSIDLSKSWVRLDASTNSTKLQNGVNYSAKLGGGSRVKEVSMSDEWNAMSQSNAETASYSMVYDYTTTMKLANGQTVTASSGVASYEPMIGNEENPLHQPITYQQKIKLGPDNAFFLDQPLCESYFPGASVGYSKVTVRNKGADGQVGATGYTVSEFYTEKDFPTIVNHTALDAKPFGGGSILQLLKIKKNNSRVVSQGYTVELNDMQGKPKSERVIDKAGNEISSAYYYYKTSNANTAENTLSNDAMVLQNDGTVNNSVIGRDIEMYTDMRSQTSWTAGINVMVNLDAIYLLFAIVPVPTILPLPNAEYTGYRSASTVKVIQRYGILSQVVKRQNGSQITTENLAWDANTGEVLLTRSQNEYDDPVYSLNYPSHWVYEKGMGPAFRNIGLVITNFSATAGIIPSNTASSYLVSGDQLLVNDGIGNLTNYWVNNAGTATSPNLVLIDANGKLASVLSGTATIVRSGRRNMHSMSVGALVSLNNPIRNGKLDIGQFTNVLDANGSIYNDEWAIEVAQTCSPATASPNIVQSTVTVCPGDTHVSYTKCGSYIYSQLAYAGNATTWRQLIPTTNTFWMGAPGGFPCDEGQSGPVAGARLARTDTTSVAGKLSSNSLQNLAVLAPQGPLVRSGIWGCTNGGTKANGTIAFNFPLTITSTNNKPYYLGIACDNYAKLYVDNVLQVNLNLSQNFYIWHIFPLPASLLTVGTHSIRVEGTNDADFASFGCEIYHNTATEISNAQSYSNLDVVFSTSNFIGTSINMISSISCPTGYSLDQSTYPGVCRLDAVTNARINPYLVGLRGNWRLQKSYAYHTDRDSKLPYIKPGDPDVIEKTDIRKSGVYTSFTPFWTYNPGQWLASFQMPMPDANWVKASEATAFNQKGQGIENVDALNRYSSALFGYLQSLPTAVASNARYTDIAYDGFEDYGFSLDSCKPNICNLDGHFSLRTLSLNSPAAISPDPTYAHTGKNSLKVTGAVDAIITKSIVPATYPSLYKFISSEMQITDLGTINGFKPLAGKTYLLSAWIKDNPPATQPAGQDQSTNVQLISGETTKAAVEIISGGTTLASTVKAGPRIEGWRKVETFFTLPANATDIQIRFRPGSTVAYFDDIRIHPFDAQMKSYAYDNSSTRLWAEMDENNFASFYEYDDEGILIRVKKETERGIMTIKESRSSYRLKK